MKPKTYDTLIVGSGFAGSLLALMLTQRGQEVLVVEKGQHPRFAIGESSTPVADLLLRRIAERYQLPWLRDFTRYGTWKATHPEISCGLKRGFSFYPHRPGEVYHSDEVHSQELLVAASADDAMSDTNWFREDWDAYLVQQLKAAGISYYESCEVVSVSGAGPWTVDIQHAKDCSHSRIQARFLIDATGAGGLAQRCLGVHSSSDGFLTRSMAVYTHVEGAPRWSHVLHNQGIRLDHYPYDPDHSALHQLLDEGWMWILRFDNGRTSMGLLLDPDLDPGGSMDAQRIWNETLSRYPTLKAHYAGLQPAPTPGHWIRTPRLQRRLSQVSGPGWAALPHAAGFVDPLFSPGIAHTLSGVNHLAELMLAPHTSRNAFHQNLQAYESKVFQELAFIDRLIGGCYQTLGKFELFNAWSMMYFAATISHETRLILGDTPTCFLEADNQKLLATVAEAYQDLQQVLARPEREALSCFTDRMRTHIAPYQQAGLLDPSLHNLYAHSAAVL